MKTAAIILLILLAGAAAGQGYGEHDGKTYIQWSMHEPYSSGYKFRAGPLNADGDSITITIDGKALTKDKTWGYSLENAGKLCGGLHSLKVESDNHYPYERTILIKCFDKMADGNTRMTLRPTGQKYTPFENGIVVYDQHTLKPIEHVKVFASEEYKGLTDENGLVAYTSSMPPFKTYEEGFVFTKDGDYQEFLLVYFMNGSTFSWVYNVMDREDWDQAVEWGKADVSFLVFKEHSSERVGSASIFIDGEFVGKTNGLGYLGASLPDCSKPEILVELVKEGFETRNTTITRIQTTECKEVKYSKQQYCAASDPESSNRYSPYISIITMAQPVPECKPDEILCKARNECVVSPLLCYDEYYPKTPCSAGWPAHEGGSKGMQLTLGPEYQISACDLYEVNHNDVREKVEHAINCCANECPTGCSKKLCESKRKDAGLNEGMTHSKLKTCTAMYTIEQMGSAAEILQKYYYPEVFCDNRFSTTSVGTLGFGNWGCGYYEPAFELSDLWNKSLRIEYNANTLQMEECEKYHYVNGELTSPLGWASDTDMSKNSCVLSPFPAHATINKMRTGTCHDYSLVMTTLFRTMGFDGVDAYSVSEGDHVWNLVKFPEEDKWTVVDTVGNKHLNYLPKDVLPDEDYCGRLSNAICENDYGVWLQCPAASDVWGCD